MKFWVGRASSLLLALGVLGYFAAPAAAQQVPADEPFHYSEVRVGVLAHDVRFAGGVEGGVDLNAEITSPSLVPPTLTVWAPLWLQAVLNPRLHFGVEPNISGRTSQIYAGVTWSAVLARRIILPGDAIEFNFLFGPALNDGDHHSDDSYRKSVGSSVLFHLGGEISYRLTPQILLGLYFDHSSNGGFARYNDSLNDFGLRVGYRF